MLRGGEALDGAIAAVMVRNEKALVGDDFPGAAPSELDYSVLEGGLVDVVDFIWSELAARGPKILAVHLLEKRQQPHSLVRHRGNEDSQSCDKCDKSFHITVFISPSTSCLLCEYSVFPLFLKTLRPNSFCKEGL